MSSQCLRTPHISRVCDGCGKQPEKYLHMTLNGPGFYCDRGCCPACSQKTEASKTNSFERPRGAGVLACPQTARRSWLSRLTTATPATFDRTGETMPTSHRRAFVPGSIRLTELEGTATGEIPVLVSPRSAVVVKEA